MEKHANEHEYSKGCSTTGVELVCVLHDAESDAEVRGEVPAYCGLDPLGQFLHVAAVAGEELESAGEETWSVNRLFRLYKLIANLIAYVFLNGLS